MLTKRWLFGLVMALVAGTALFFARTGGWRSAPAVHRKAVSATGARDVESEPAKSRPLTETDTVSARAYELAFQQEFATGEGAPSRVRVAATIEIAPRDAAGRDLVRLGPVASEGDGVPRAEELAVVFARVRDAAGHLEAIEVPPATTAEARRYLRAIAGALEYTLAPGAEWQASELDVGGRFAASYRRLEDGKVERFRRQLLASAAQPALPMSMRLEGRTVLTFDRNDALEALQTDERAELSTGDDWRLRAHLSVSLKRRGEVGARWATSPGTLEREGILANPVAERGAAQTDRARVAGRSLAELRAELESLDELPESMERSRERARLMQDHAALLRLDPAALRAVAERLKDAATPASERSLLAGSLAAAGTPEASHALGDVLKSAPLPDARLHAAVALNVSPAHDTETLAALEAGTQDADPDVANTARLALGNALRTVEGGGGTSPGSAELLAKAYADASSIEERTHALGAIGNSGDASLLPLVEHALSDPSPQIQETATFALRFMSAAADPLLGRALSSPFPGVRGAAVRAVELRPMGALRPSLESAFAVEPLADLKRALERLLARTA